MDKNTQKELLIFKKLSSEKDYGLLEDSEIAFGDFQRISYILSTLGLSDLDMYFFEKHIDKFYTEMTYLDRLDDICSPYVDITVCIRWLKDFRDNIQNKIYRRLVNEKFELND